jgi:hypothetical protein
VSGISQAENKSRLIVELPLDPQAPSPECRRRLMPDKRGPHSVG